MAGMLSDTWQILTAAVSNDSWMFSQALKSPATWPIGLVVTLLGALVFVYLYKKSAWFEHHFERTVMVWTYLLIAAIIFVEVFRRFVLNQQAPWSTTLPPFLFLIMTWAGCAYNVKLRTHLSFAEFRSNMSRKLQFSCLCLDAVLWFGFSWVVVVTSTRVAVNSAANFQILLGTDNVLQWWFLTTVPVSFVLIAARSIENLLIDYANLRSGEPLITQAVIGGN